MKDLISIYALSSNDIKRMLENAELFKKRAEHGEEYHPLRGMTLGLIFDKLSTRTRISFEVGMYQLGGLPLFINTRDMQLQRGETVSDTAKMLSLYLNAVVIRTYKQEVLEEFASHCSIPVINGLTDLLHPCQIISDLFTISERYPDFEGIKVAYIGDGNNVANSWIHAAIRLPFRLSLACPEGYAPDKTILERGMIEAAGRITLGSDPTTAARDAHVIYTDVWASMGQESEKEKRMRALAPYQVNMNLLSLARPDVMVMHCLPAHRGEEITAEVLDGEHSCVLEQAENRLHVQKAILEILLRKGG